MQPFYLHIILSPHTSSQPITSCIYQHLLYLLTNQIAHQGFWIFNWLKSITWLWRWLSRRLSKTQSPATVLLRTPVTQMIFFNQVVTHINCLGVSVCWTGILLEKKICFYFQLLVTLKRKKNQTLCCPCMYVTYLTLCCQNRFSV